MFGIVIPPQIIPAAPSSVSCAYSVMINDDRYKPIYKCYTESEFKSYQENIKKENDKQVKQSQEYIKSYSPLIVIIFIVIICAISYSFVRSINNA